MLNVLIAEDHAMVRKGLVHLLQDELELDTVGEASNGRDALELALSRDWNVMVLDITMPILNGYQVLRQIKLEKPNLPVVILSMHDSLGHVEGALVQGASGYVSKEAAPEELVAAIRSALAGEFYVSGSLRHHLKAFAAKKLTRPDRIH